ncbi:MAG: helix-turn-helix domain-containing protein [Candidatus Methanoplasma sp.]|jgi:predicted transcriptional regulator|nr:helix-turn-helix domain-containing protein [Candidatus Methanoplasma sp.]
MNEIDMILAAVENPTRRRILESLARGSGYPLQLSRELGVSPQAVVKNLSVLEGAGMVERRREAGRGGPERTMYSLMSEFSVTIDLRSGMFRAGMPHPGGAEARGAFPDGLERAVERIAELDGEVRRLDSLRAEALRERSWIISSVMAGASGLDLLGRTVLHEMLDRPGGGAEEISARLAAGEAAVRKAMREIEDAFTEVGEDGE